MYSSIVHFCQLKAIRNEYLAKEYQSSSVFKQPPPTEEKPKARRPQDDVLPSSPEEWAQYDCPEDVRQAFRYDTSPHCINRHSLSKQAGTTKLSLTASVIEPNGVMFIRAHRGKTFCNDS